MTKTPHPRFTRIAAACGVLLLAGAAQAQQYTVTDLSALTDANAINAHGDVAGYYYGSKGFQGPNLYQGAVVYHGGAAQNFGLAGTGGGATGINDLGQVVGWSVDGQGVWSSYLYSSGSLIPGPASNLTAINNAGQVTGGLGVYTGGMWTSFPYGYSAMALNSSGVVAGGDRIQTVAFTYDSGTGVYTSLPYPSHDGYDIGNAINDAGEVAGISGVGYNVEHAFYWQGGMYQDLGSLAGAESQSAALGINNAGTIVGWTDASSGHEDAFVTLAGVMTDLNSLLTGPSDFSFLQSANAINARGQIVCQGLGIDGLEHAFLLTPVGAVPEPASWALALAGLGLIGVCLKRRRGMMVVE